MLRRLLLTLTILTASATIAIAAGRAPSSNELAGLERDISTFVKATENNQAADIIAALPERVIPNIAEMSGMKPGQLRDMLVSNARAFGQQAKPESIAADLGDMKLQDVKSRNGGTLTWGLFTLSGTAMVGPERIAFSAQTIAIQEGGDWHFARIDAPGQADMIQSVYPEIKRLPRAR